MSEENKNLTDFTGENNQQTEHNHTNQERQDNENSTDKSDAGTTQGGEYDLSACNCDADLETQRLTQMSDNKNLSDFTDGSDRQDENKQSTDESRDDNGSGSKMEKSSIQERTDNTHVCSSYRKKEAEYQDKLEERRLPTVECGRCIEYLCNGVSSGTATTYASHLRQFLDFIHQRGMCVEDVGFVDVRDYFEYRAEDDRAKSTISVEKAAIRGVISRYEAECEGMPEVSYKISENIDPSNYSTGVRYERNGLNTEDVKKLIGELNTFRDKLLVLVILETGPRSESARKIKISDVDLNNKEIELENTKTGGWYVVPLTDQMASLLNHWIKDIRSSHLSKKDNPYLFPSKMGGYLSSKRLCTIVNEAAERAGIQETIAKIPNDANKSGFVEKKKVDVHALRHTFKHRLNECNVSKESITYAMDHSKDVTVSYGKDDVYKEEIRAKFGGVDLSNLGIR
ncbi:hypothetical protein JCM18237_28210 [Halorubrum luteum]